MNLNLAYNGVERSTLSTIPEIVVPTYKLSNYVRAYRKRVGWSQTEAAYLLGVVSGSKVSRYESFTRTPSLRTALQLEIITGIPVRELFAGLCWEALQIVGRRARHLKKRVERQTRDPYRDHKLAILSAILDANRDKSRRNRG